MVIRAGVDDRQMVSALGVNIQLTFALAFFVGSALAGFGGAIGGSFASSRAGVDAQLAAVLARRRDHRRDGLARRRGRRLDPLGLVFDFSAIYLPPENNCSTYYSIIFTFALLALVLAFRPPGPLREAGMSAHAVARPRARHRCRGARRSPALGAVRSSATTSPHASSPRCSSSGSPRRASSSSPPTAGWSRSPDLDLRHRRLRARQRRHERRA